MTIGATIKHLRQGQDMTQEQLAEALGITSRAVSQWENGRTTPDISQLPALANFFDVTTDYLLGVDIKRKEDEVQRIIGEALKYDQRGDQKGKAEHLKEQIKTYPNEPLLLSHLASALQCYYFIQGNADTEQLKKEKTNEIITLCERALKYSKPTDDNSSVKQILLMQYLRYMGEKERAKEVILSLPFVSCTREMFESELYDGREALRHKQSALLMSFMTHMHNLFWQICHDDTYSCEQKIEILNADAAVIELITAGKPNWFYGPLSAIAAEQAVFFYLLGDDKKALEMLETAYTHADNYETRSDGEKYAPCWLSEIDDKQEYICRTATDTAYYTLYRKITEHRFADVFSGNERFERLMNKLKEKISK